MSEFKLNFQDTATAFADKTNVQLREKYWLFKTMGSQALVNFGTALTNFALSFHLPVKTLIKKTLFRQFCGGETIAECEPTIRKLGKSNIGTILDYSVEGKSDEEDFCRTKNEIIETVKRAGDDANIPFAVFKTTGIAPLGTLEKMSAGIALTDQGKAKWQRIQERVDEICRLAHSLEQPVFIDAEDSWIQNSIDTLAESMTEKYNREKPIVFNTIQLYRHDRLEFLKSSHRKAKENGCLLAVKLVRGAYMEKERSRAVEMNYPSPIQADKAATDRDYDAAIDFCLENISDIAFVAGTHNEKSVQMLAQKMEARKIPHNHPHVFFSQLFGMSDNLSYILADNQYNVSKYVPYGPVEDAVPYLIRRAKENTSVMGQMSRELDLIDKELKRRSGDGY